MIPSQLTLDLVSGFRGLSFDTSTEAALQAAIETILAPIGFIAERHTREGRLDFFREAEGLCIEVKVDGSVNDLRRQVLRYLNLPEVREILVLTTVARHRDAAELYRVSVYNLNSGQLATPPQEPLTS